MYHIDLKKDAEKILRKIPHKEGDKIISKIHQLATNPYPVGYKKLTGYVDMYRIRVGDYRVIYQIYDERLVIFIIKIGHRKNIYE